MSFYSYKNANPESSPGRLNGETSRGLCEKVCVQLKKVFDSCLQQEQLDNVCITVTGIAPVCKCTCGCSTPNACTCGNCATCATVLTDAEAQRLRGPIPPLTFNSCRSNTMNGTVRSLTIDRLCDRPQFGRVKCLVDIPIDILFTDSCCNEFMGRGIVTITKDVLLAIPDESIVPFTVESLVSAICVSGCHAGGCQFNITICVTVILKVLAEVELLIPAYGLCPVPPCEEFAESVCDEFFALPLFPSTTICDMTNAANCDLRNRPVNCANCTSTSTCATQACANTCGGTCRTRCC